jgi:hypothetical protein
MLAMSLIEQPAPYSNLGHAFLTGEKSRCPTIDWTAIPDGYRDMR